jgi:hypothetical protein
VRPMILQDAQVYAWKGDDGSLKLADAKPKGVGPLLLADDENTVLTLTAQQAITVGLGRSLPGGAAEVGKALGRTGWTTPGDFGLQAMERAKKAWAAKKVKVQKIIDKFEDAVKAANRYLDAAAAIHPNKYTYEVRNGYLTPEAKAEWVQRTDACINSYNRVLGAIAEAEREDKNLQKQGFPTQLNRAGVQDLKERVKIDMRLLQANRNRETL